MKFERQIRRFAKKAPEEAARKIKSAAFLAYRDIVAETPVDTGRARAGWTISVKKVGEFFVLMQNKVPYIKYLAEGSSKQANKGWIDRILDKIPGNIKRM